jgi:ABC-type branched-subunit amino acid transport system ATPase component
VLSTGRVTLEGKGFELLNDPRVQASYLGVSAG